MSGRVPQIDSFDLTPGRVLAGKYCVDAFLGSGWEGEVYRVTELRTGVSRAAKLFYPQRNVRDRAVRRYARKLDRLEKCPIVMRYHHLEVLNHRRTRISVLISELVEGELLEDFVNRQRGRRLEPYQALHVLHTLVCGVEQIHRLREYHGDLHDRNVLIQPRGVHFDLKLLDFYHWGRTTRENTQDDVLGMVRILYDAVGGRKYYAAQPRWIKDICRGLRRDLILRRFATAGQLRDHLESFGWDG